MTKLIDKNDLANYANKSTLESILYVHWISCLN